MTGNEPSRLGRTGASRGATMQGQRAITIGIVDPVPLYRDGLAALLERTPWTRLVAQSASGQGALMMAEQLSPDVVVIDSSLVSNGQLIQALSVGTSPSRVVVTVREDERSSRNVAGYMAAGAHAAVLRTAAQECVLDAIRHAHRAHRYLDPTLTSAVTASKGKLESVKAGKDASGTSPLSRREFQVMQLIAEGLENAAIAKVLFLSVETVRTHVKSILRKLSARDRTHAVTIAFRSGLLSITPDGSLPSRDFGAHVTRRTRERSGVAM